jgi:hypothetical protein
VAFEGGREEGKEKEKSEGEVQEEEKEKCGNYLYESYRRGITMSMRQLFPDIFLHIFLKTTIIPF